MWSDFCLLSFWGYKRLNLPGKCNISIMIITPDRQIAWKIHLKKFTFSKVGSLPWKITLLNINSATVASAIIICNIYTECRRVFYRRWSKHNIYDNVKKSYDQPGLCAATQTQLYTRICNWRKKLKFFNYFENNFSLTQGNI